MNIKDDGEQIELTDFSNSPVHGLKPINDEPVWIKISDIDLDLTNPGSVTESLRYQRRTPSIRDSYDILGRIIYPIIVCQNFLNSERFVHIDGFGRLEQLKERGEEKVSAYVYPPMTLEQRICFRQTLNAAQEPFDAVSIIQDLKTLAQERKLDIHNPEHVKTLVRDLPEKVRKHEDDILELSRWHTDIVDSMGESYGNNPKSIGMDKLRELGRIMTVMAQNHQQTLKHFNGLQNFSKIIAQMYLDRRFAESGRSQEGIRKVTRSLKTLPPDDPSIRNFFEATITIQALERTALSAKPNEKGIVVAGCTNFINILLGLNTSKLSEDEVSALKRTASVLESILSEVSD